jgi:hypothetical protein
MTKDVKKRSSAELTNKQQLLYRIPFSGWFLSFYAKARLLHSHRLRPVG